MTTEGTSAPLSGVRIVEFAGIGPGPFAGMMLADMGAEVIRIDRPGAKTHPADFLARGRRSMVLDLKKPEAARVALRLLDSADALIEGYRPGVMERLGLGPDVVHARNPKLVYGRMTGWGQDGPLSHAAGHDLNYIALSGALWGTGAADQPPSFPMNLLGDFGGGAMYLAFGMVTALFAAERTGQGDVVDAAICDGAASLMAMTYSFRAMGRWRDERGANLLDGGVPWYGVYTCADGKWITIGPLEPKFWDELLRLLGIDAETFGDRSNRADWPAMRDCFAEVFQTQPRDYWTTLLEGTDACVAPVLSYDEARAHPHNAARGVFAPDGPEQPMPAPRFARAQTPLPAPAPRLGADTRAVLRDAGLSETELDALYDSGVVA
ncbi:CaiB/BaiF CoA transferase family protein [Tropicibacter naphthalenivorans]|uniref:Crotonobetainyl-CoA:carnitine CoA-transferase n=1 Tax=Tropicibacter naphthalenivorans TaxID=441103 RepID=A0A0P1GYB9_9RHOB|nr:CaiB/BaiF CoA-transferase family protein [Tropicibacter naphthalenivorans]CUH81126.1 Crotonobetainyl-CoA:carnitine CoA-transferase [Tropicibacter naphthalenivorans]SMC97275.1 alpha-methylacyl-CoA racemase [Tropicibacter naphthalenivorans]